MALPVALDTTDHVSSDTAEATTTIAEAKKKRRTVPFDFMVDNERTATGVVVL